MSNEKNLDSRSKSMRKLREDDVRKLREDELDFVAGGQGVVILSPSLALYPH